VDTTIYDKIQVKPFIIGLSDHDAQIICLQNANIGLKQSVSKKKSRLINEQNIKDFQMFLQDETWDTIYTTTCINEMYNRFQGTFLRHYGASFPVCYTNYKSSDNKWVTKGIKISHTKKREIYSLYRNNKDNIQVRDHYKKYCNVLKRVIYEAKRKTIFP
jgi:cupin superfamily acireductone dioxygenase involved in methionine salvage